MQLMSTEKPGNISVRSFNPQIIILTSRVMFISVKSKARTCSCSRSYLRVIQYASLAHEYAVNIGEYKSKTIIDLIRDEKPSVVVELGGYVGYSAIAFGAALKMARGKRYYSLEMNPEFAAVISMLVDLAGLSDIVKVVVGPSSDSIKRLFKEGILKHIDLLFLDHIKPAYTPDLKICEELGLVSKGSICAADNGIPNPANFYFYLAYSIYSHQTWKPSVLGIREKHSRREEEEGWEDRCY